jgi:hypothetical protein
MSSFNVVHAKFADNADNAHGSECGRQHFPCKEVLSVQSGVLGGMRHSASAKPWAHAAELKEAWLHVGCVER